MPERERDIETYFKQRVKEEGGLTRKLKWIGRNGAMDQFVALNNKVALVEIKRPGKEPTAAQDRERQRLIDQGVNATWVSTKEQVDRCIDWLMDRTENAPGFFDDDWLSLL